MPETESRSHYDPIRADAARGCLSFIIATMLMVTAALCCAGFLAVAHWNADKDWFPGPQPATTTPTERNLP